MIAKMPTHLSKLPTDIQENIYKIAHNNNLANVLKEMHNTSRYIYVNYNYSKRIVYKKPDLAKAEDKLKDFKNIDFSYSLVKPCTSDPLFRNHYQVSCFDYTQLVLRGYCEHQVAICTEIFNVV